MNTRRPGSNEQVKLEDSSKVEMEEEKWCVPHVKVLVSPIGALEM